MQIYPNCIPPHDNDCDLFSEKHNAKRTNTLIKISSEGERVREQYLAKKKKSQKKSVTA